MEYARWIVVNASMQAGVKSVLCMHVMTMQAGAQSARW